MTINNLQTTLIGDIEKALELTPLKGASGKGKRIKAYPQALPIVEARLGWETEEDAMYESHPEDELFPYAVIRIVSTCSQDDQEQATVYIMFGIFNDDREMAGYYDLLNVIEMVVNRYRTNTVVEEFYCERKMSVEIQQDDSYPYFFGGIEMTWNLPQLTPEGEYYG